MQWDSSQYAGFSKVEPWLPLGLSSSSCNVAALREIPRSILNLYRRLVDVRRKHLALSVGDYAQLAVSSAQVLAYEREFGADRHVVVLNFGHCDCEVALPQTESPRCILLSTCLDRDGEPIGRILKLRPHEGVIVAYG